MPYEDKEIDPTVIITSFALTLSLFPFIAVILDPIFGQRTTLRDIINLYKGK